MVVIGFSGTGCSSLYVSEGAGSVSIRLFVQNGVLDRDVIVTLSTRDGSAICESSDPMDRTNFTVNILPCVHCLISPAGIDYEAVTTNLTFNDCMSAQVVTIPILHDLIVENSESFHVTLTTFDTAVTLGLQTTSVTIRDDDSKLHCNCIRVSCCLNL